MVFVAVKGMHDISLANAHTQKGNGKKCCPKQQNVSQAFLHCLRNLRKAIDRMIALYYEQFSFAAILLKHKNTYQAQSFLKSKFYLKSKILIL